ncbi:MAG: hypothetical protein P8X73_08070 [Ignavibacteriaceae bacterium]
MIKIADINQEAKEKLPPDFSDKSGIGVHYMDAYIKPMNTKLEDGTRISCKRKGLKVTLVVGSKKGEGLMRRLDVSKDPVEMLNAALLEAAKAAGVEINITDSEILISP